ncbi:MAG: GDP-mannose 4,6-dehydratase [Alphaproteobacteria bacterium]
MTILVTGAAGFIGFHLSKFLLNKNISVVGIDNINNYYDINLKLERLNQLKNLKNFSFFKGDINDEKLLEEIKKSFPNIKNIVHLAAQVGVRYSIENPNAYIESNINGYIKILEFAKSTPSLEHLIFASSSSVYGANKTLPFSLDQKINSPLSVYAATKSSGELISYSYSHIYNIPITALRFFTVYGPWGRPDMAMYLFTKAIYEGKPITLYNQGQMRRDFTYIDDIVEGIYNATRNKPSCNPPFKTYNLGNNKSESLIDFINIIEENLGKKAIIDHKEMLKSDMLETYADIESSKNELNFEPKISIKEGIPLFIEWFRKYYKIK